MGWRRIGLTFGFMLVALPLSAQNKHATAPIEPTAGQWKTWVISSGKDYRVPPPPSPSETEAELHALADLIAGNDQQTAARIAYWDAGAPAYRWIDLISNRLLAGVPTTAYAHRVYAYVAMAMYDATIAVWESKYYYNRPRPTEIFGSFLREVAGRNGQCSIAVSPSVRAGASAAGRKAT